MHPIETRVSEFVSSQRLITAGNSVVVAVSGGPDSICLLHLLSTLYKDQQVCCVYVDHRLRPDESVVEGELVHNYCQEQGIECFSKTVDVPAEVGLTGESVEACARRLRYQVLEEVRSSKNADLIAVGHNADDQVEEVLLRLIRGSGLKGLSGMRPRHGRIVRPLLELTRAEILGYLQDQGISYCHDSSNDDPRFLRNRIRRELLPLLEERFNPSIRKMILKTAGILEIEEDLLSRESDRLFGSMAEIQEVQNTSGSSRQVAITIDRLSACHQAIRRRIIEQACWQAGFRPDSDSIFRIDEMSTRADSGAELHLPHGGRVVKQYDLMLFARLDANHSPRERFSQEATFKLEIPCSGAYQVAELHTTLHVEIVESRVAPEPGLLVLDADRITFPLVLRSTEPGDRFTPLHGPGSRKISRFLSDRKIPAHRRSHYPVLTSGKDIVAVVGLEIDDRYRIGEQTCRVLLVRLDALQP